MRNKLYLPRIPYVVFELIEINMEEAKAQQAGYKAKQIDTIYLAVMPESYRFSRNGRDAVTQTTDKIFVDQHPNSLEDVTISGTFGDLPRLIGGTFMDGWNRLRQFEDRIINKKLEQYSDTETPIQENIDTNKSILVVNYYDFLWQKFGTISLKDFDIDANARQNTNFIRYKYSFKITGELVGIKETFSEGDPLLYSLNTVLGPEAQKVIDDSVNNALYEAGAVTKWLGMIDVVSAAIAVVKDVIAIANNYATGAKREYEERKSQLTEW